MLKAIDEEPEQRTKKMIPEFLQFLCLEVIMVIGSIYLLRNHIYRFGVWWEKIEALMQEIVK